MRARDIMSRPVYCLTVDAGVEEAAGLMVRCGFTALPVITGDGTLFGVVTEEDIAEARFGPDEATARLALRGIRPLVRTSAPSVPEDADVRDLVAIMVDTGCRCVPVVGERNQPVGMVSWRDVLAQLLPHA